ELEGLSADTRQMLKENAEKAGKQGWLITLKPTSVFPIMKAADRRSLREEVWRANNTKCIGGEFDNTQNIIDIANTRLQIARLLGYRTYAEYVLRKRMARNTQNVMDMLNRLQTAYMPVARQEYEELQQYAAQQGLQGPLMPWDWSYYSEKLKNERYSLDDETMRPYFELEHVKQGVFGLATKLYGLHFTKKADIQVYNPEVEAFEVTDSEGHYMGVLYTDFHPREGKRGGAWMNNFQEQYVTNGVDHRPHIVIVMNFTRPTADKPALLTYDEVETFLHEFGHSLHGMLSRCTYSSQSGTNTYRDFVEMPSQFNENFLAERQFLDSFAVHYQTGEKMPQEFMDKIRAARTYHAAYSCVRQLSFGYLDMAWHTLEQPFEGTQADVIDFEHRAMTPVQLFPDVPHTAMEYAFTHIFNGGYAAGYYGYKWAEMLDADAFSVFQKNGIFDRKTADSFRTNILERGSTEQPDVLYRRFRGQDATIDALLKRDGISSQNR
ncbi:MAG: M3 family metallopeptidase, partial [Paludibacteraceae bacterium]|nr:M3 family metallopeptidase [Paludibacteraceae bacterium]